MFSLIITIISIALVAVLAVATIYYGGATFTKSGNKAAATRILTAGAQINGAVEMYKGTRGEVPATLDDLVSTNLLKSIPAGEWTTANDYVVASGINELQCKEANLQLGIVGDVPACTDEAISGVTACCSIPA